MVKALSHIPSLEERALSQAIQLSRDTALEDEKRREARLLARWELDTHLAIETSKMDEFWRTLPSQLLWLKQPSALKVLLQRPVWLRARGGSERSAAPRCWAGLPADVFGIIM